MAIGVQQARKGDRPTEAEVEASKLQFGIWLGLPIKARARDEQTLDSLAKKLGVSPRSLTNWKSDAFVQKVAENAVKILGGREKFDVIRAIIDKAKEGSAPMARLYMEWQGEVGTRRDETKVPGHIRVEFVTEENKKVKA